MATYCDNDKANAMIIRGRTLVFLTCVLFTFLLPCHARVTGHDEGVTEDGLGPKEGGELVLEASCSDYPSCQLDLEVIRNAVNSENMDEACRHATASFQCQRSATKTCEKEGAVSADALIKMKRAYLFTEIYQQEMCHSGSSPDSVVAKGGSLCSEFRSCFVDVDKYKTAAKNDLYHEGCGIATYIYQCSTSALIDCKRRGTLSQETLGMMENTVIKSGFRVDHICSYTTTTAAPSPPSHTYECFDFASCPKPDLDILQMAKRTGHFDEACRTITPYAKCMEEALTDCQGKQLVSGIALMSMQESLAKAHNNVKTYCPFYEMNIVRGRMMLSPSSSDTDSDWTFDLRTTVTPVTCLDIVSCPKPTEPMTVTMTSGEERKDHTQACRSAKARVMCLDGATQDCKVRNLVTGPALDAMVQAVEEGRKTETLFCRMAMADGDGDGPGNGGFTVLPGRNVYVIVVLVSGWFGLAAVFNKSLLYLRC